MKSDCAKWKDRLADAVWDGLDATSDDLQNHLSQCADCAAKLARLRTRRERLESLLPLLAKATEPSPDLRARIVAAAEAATDRRHPMLWRLSATVGAVAAMALLMIFLVLGHNTHVTEADLRGAQALAQWRAPTDVFLRTPGQEFLNSTPRLGESYITIPADTEGGGSK
jgi:hypothetical protein